MAKVADFLEKVSSDEAFEEKFDKNPKKVMDEFGLSEHAAGPDPARAPRRRSVTRSRTSSARTPSSSWSRCTSRVVAEPVARVGSLTIVGAGIRPGLHTTREAIARIKDADKVLYLLAEIAPVRWLEELNPSAESLEHRVPPRRPFAEVYEEIVSTIVDHVREGLDVCVVFYGHPGVFDRTSYDAVARVRAEGFAARILPGITAEDCLYVDLELDPGSDRVPELRRDGLPRSTAGDPT